MPAAKPARKEIENIIDDIRRFDKSMDNKPLIRITKTTNENGCGKLTLSITYDDSVTHYI